VEMEEEGKKEEWKRELLFIWKGLSGTEFRKSMTMSKTK